MQDIGKEASSPGEAVEKHREADLDPFVFQDKPLLSVFRLTPIFHQEAFSLYTCCRSRLLPLLLSGENGSQKCADPEKGKYKL